MLGAATLLAPPLLAGNADDRHDISTGSGVAHAAAGSHATMRVHTADGKLIAHASQSAGDDTTTMHVGGAGGTLPSLTLADPAQPIRLLIRLHEEPVLPFLQRRLKQLGGSTKQLDAGQSAALKQAVAAHSARLKRQQDDLLSDLTANGHIDAVHGHFVQLTNTLSVSAHGQQLDALKADPRVHSVHPDSRVTINLAASVGQIGAPAVWAMRDRLDREATGHGVRVAILDTGIDYRHPDLGGCLGPGCKVVGGHDFVNNDADPLDDHGHGTHVAGIVAADGHLRGVAPHVQLLAYKVLDQFGNGHFSGIIAALERATDPDQDPLTADRADVINMSLGGQGEVDSPLSEAAANAVAAGSVVVVAAGNRGPAAESIDSPGNVAQVITVAASDADDVIASFSSRGPIANRDYVKPEISAPGVGIQSTTLGNRHERHSGTSMAAPHVAGAAALLRQLQPQLSPEAVKAQLLAGARAPQADVFAQGVGRIDVSAATAATLRATPSVLGFGLVDVTQPHWQGRQTLRLHNPGDAPQTLQLNAEGNLPAGAQLGFEPAGDLQLAAGETRELQVTLSVDNTVLPYPDNATLHFEAAIAVQGAGPVLRVPLAFHKADLLRLTVEREPGAGYWIWVRAYYGEYVNWILGSTVSDTHALRVRPGDYYALSQLSTHHGWSWVLQEDITVAGAASRELSATDAVHPVHVTGVIDAQGNEVASNLMSDGMTVMFGDPRLKEWMITANSGGAVQPVVRLSGMSDRFKIIASVPLHDPRASDADQVRYLLNTVVRNGVDKPVALQLDARTSGHARLEFDHPQRAQLGPLAVQLDHRLLLPIQGGLAQWASISNQIPAAFAGPLRASLYANTPDLDLDAGFAELRVSRVLSAGTPDAIGEPLIASGVLGFPTAGGYARLASVDVANNRAIASLESSSPRLDIHHGAAFFASRVAVEGHYIATHNDGLEVWWRQSPLLKDLRQNAFDVRLPYALSCIGSAEEDVGEIGAFQLIAIPTRCHSRSLDLRLSMSVDVLGAESASLVEYRFTAGPGYWNAAPQLTRLELLSDGDVSRVLDGDDLQVRLQWALRGVPDVPHQVRLDYQREDQPGWQPLAVERDGSFHVARLPQLTDGPQLAALRIFAASADGSSQQQTLHSLFILGKNPARQTFMERRERRLRCVDGC